MVNSQESIIKKIARSLVFIAIDSVSCFLCQASSKKETIIQIPENVLIVELAMLGDLFISTPLYASIRKNFPNSKITLVCTPWSKDAICDSGFFNDIFTYEAFWEDRSTGSRPAWKHAKSTIKLLRKLRSSSFDVCFAVASRKQPFIPFIAFLSKAKVRVGIKYGIGDRFLTHLIAESEGPLFYSKQNLLKSIYPPAIIPEKFSFKITEKSKLDIENYLKREFKEDRPRYICISPSTSQPEKLWKIDGWVILANWFNSKGIAVLISGGKSDLPYISAIYGKVDQKDKCRNIAGLFSINQIAAVFQQSMGLVTVESAPMHLAGLLDIFCIVLMSRIYNYKKFVPVSQKVRILVKDIDCAQCEKGCASPRCMDFTPDEVIKAVDSLLSLRQ